jgi:S-adenosylmethionine:tRNA ribosyltransferase-isomerase
MSQHPSLLDILDFTFDLPQEKIAEYPLQNRDDAKLLVYKNEAISESVFKNITEFLPEECVLIFNDTRVVQARLFFQTAKEQSIEVFCLEPFNAAIDITQAMLSTKTVLWKCLVGNLKKWRDEVLSVTINDITVNVKIIEKRGVDVVVEFNWEPAELCFAEVLEKIGVMPIPPYLKRKSDESDAIRYQTIYAAQSGSVAAPTAGLHFTPNVTEQLKNKNIQSLYVTLHVGAGTFKPVKSATLAGHAMHHEWITVDRTVISTLINNGSKKIITVGTTSLRTIESLYWIGLKVFYDPQIKPENLELDQWFPYDCVQDQISNTESLNALLIWLAKNNLNQLTCKTSILIAPPYKLKLADGIITNFHQPQSTLLLLISCVVGEKWKGIYDYALSNNFRFLSYGDSSLLLK